MKETLIKKYALRNRATGYYYNIMYRLASIFDLCYIALPLIVGTIPIDMVNCDTYSALGHDFDIQQKSLGKSEILACSYEAL